MSDIFSRIKARRIELDMTQDELAKKLGYKEKSIISKIENGKSDIPQSKIEAFALALSTKSSYLLGWDEDKPITAEMNITDVKGYVKGIFGMNAGTMMPVLGKVQAGTPVEAIRDIVGEIAVTKEMARSGEYFALKVKGNSMEPMLHDGFIVIVKRQSDVENGEVGVVIVNGSDATIKKVEKHEEGILLVPINNEFKTEFYSNDKIRSLPVEVIGKVVEYRGTL